MLSTKSVSSVIFTWRRGSAYFSPQGTFLSFCSQQTLPDSDPIDEKLKSDAHEEEIEKKRFQARLSDQVYRRFIKKEYLPPVNKVHFTKKFLRKKYGRYGEETGLNPGIAWPTREELQEIIEHDKMFHPPLREMLDKIAAAEREKEQERLEYEAEVDENMQKLEVYKKEYYARIAKKNAAAEAIKLKNQQLIEKISELLGYDVSPKDPKFQEAADMIKKEEKKVQKEKKQQESYSKMVAKLASIAASSKKAAALESQAETEKTAEEKHDEKPE